MSGEAILSAENSGNLWEVGAPPRTPLGELTVLPKPLAGGNGVAAHTQEPHPRSRSQPFSLAPNQESWHAPECGPCLAKWVFECLSHEILQNAVFWHVIKLAFCAVASLAGCICDAACKLWVRLLTALCRPIWSWQSVILDRFIVSERWCVDWLVFVRVIIKYYAVICDDYLRQEGYVFGFVLFVCLLAGVCKKYFPSVLWHCWLGDRKGIRPVKKLDVGLLVVMIWLELCTTYSSSCHHHLHHPLLQ